MDELQVDQVESSIKKTVQHLVRIGKVVVARARNARDDGNNGNVLALVHSSMGRLKSGVLVVDLFECLGNSCTSSRYAIRNLDLDDGEFGFALGLQL